MNGKIQLALGKELSFPFAIADWLSLMASFEECSKGIMRNMLKKKKKEELTLSRSKPVLTHQLQLDNLVLQVPIQQDTEYPQDNKVSLEPLPYLFRVNCSLHGILGSKMQLLHSQHPCSP